MGSFHILRESMQAANFTYTFKTSFRPYREFLDIAESSVHCWYDNVYSFFLNCFRNIVLYLLGNSISSLLLLSTSHCDLCPSCGYVTTHNECQLFKFCCDCLRHWRWHFSHYHQASGFQDFLENTNGFQCWACPEWLVCFHVVHLSSRVLSLGPPVWQLPVGHNFTDWPVCWWYCHTICWPPSGWCIFKTRYNLTMTEMLK